MKHSGSWTIVSLLMSLTFVNYLNRLCLASAGSSIRATYGISESQFGTVISAFLLTYTICMLPGGWLADRLGGRVTLTFVGFGTACFAALTGVLGLAVPVTMTTLVLGLLWLVRAAMGVCTAPLFPAAGRVVTRRVPRTQRAGINALVNGAAMLGLALSYPICGALIDANGWPVALIGLALVTAGLAWAWFLLSKDAEFPSPLTSGADAKPGSWRTLLTNRSLCLLTTSYAAVGYVEYLVFYWSEDYFKKTLRVSDSENRLATMIPPLCMAICMLLGGRLCDWLLPRIGYRASRAGVAAVGMVGCAGFLIGATMIDSDLRVGDVTVPKNILIVASFALSLAMIGFTESPMWATALDLGEPHSASSAAMANTGGNIGGTLSPTLTPWISALLVSRFQLTEAAGWAWSIRGAGLVCLCGAILWLWIDPQERR